MMADFISIRDDLIVVGAGPAGLMAALLCAEAGLRIRILEKTAKPGRKLMLTGSGQCNLTHDGAIREFLPHYAEHSNFIKRALLGFTNQDLMDFFTSRGIPLITRKDGKIFPAGLQAGMILNTLLNRIRAAGGILECNSAVTRIDVDSAGFYIETGKKKFQAQRVLMACGGLSYPQTGSDGTGWKIARELGHCLIEPRPALTPVYPYHFTWSHLAGLSFNSSIVSFGMDKKLKKQFSGELLITHKGFSGPVILHSSRYLAQGHEISINFTGIPADQYNAQLLNQFRSHPTRNLENALSSGELTRKFVATLLEELGIDGTVNCAQVTQNQRKNWVNTITNYRCVVEKIGGFEVAMVTAGGVSTDEINPKTLESRQINSLYFAGEMINIDGDTGGFNLQAAFSTAVAAARSIIASFSTEPIQ